MQRSIQYLCKRLLLKSQISKEELLTLTRLSGKDALSIKPLKAFMYNLERHSASIKNLNHCLPISSSLKHDITALQHYTDLYDNDRSRFDDVFDPNTKIQLNAFSMYGIHAFIDTHSDDAHNKFDKEWNELSSIYELLNLYKDKFKGKHIQIYCQNPSVIRMLNQYNANASKPYLQTQITKIAAICLDYRINPFWAQNTDIDDICNDELGLKQSIEVNI